MACETIGSLFSGIGGLELGLEWATGARTVWNCETDEFCRRVLAKHWPEATQYEDVREIDEQAPTTDIICGGFPCQNLSIAGDRRGLAGDKSGLWSEYARIVRLLRPRFVFVENVTALRNFVSDEGLGRVLGDLAESGYDAEWDCVPAAAVGAPHIRDRLFLLAWRRDLADPASGGRRPRASGHLGAGASPEQGHAARAAGSSPGPVAHADGSGLQERRGTGPARAESLGAQRGRGDIPGGGWPPPPGSPEWGRWLEEHPSAQPGIRRASDGSARNVDPHRRRRLRALGNAVVPQAAARAWHLLIERAGVQA